MKKKTLFSILFLLKYIIAHLKEIKKRSKEIPLLDPIEDMGIKDKNLIEIVKVRINFPFMFLIELNFFLNFFTCET